MKKPHALKLLGSNLQQTLVKLCRKHRVCGASIAILKDGVIHTAAAGWANAPERIEATPSTVFQIGSITKTITATLAMQLVEEGLLDLDSPLSRYLPDFTTADPRSADLTIRQLITHTSGLVGDFFPADESFDGGASDYMRKISDLGQLHEPGEYVSYCNSGYVVLTRIIEVLRNESFNDLVRNRICEPLKLIHAITKPQESLTFRVATGHAPGKNKQWALARPYFPLSMAGAGTVISMSATDLVRYAEAHMLGPTRRSGKDSMLSQESFRAMQTPQLEMTPYSRNPYTHMGLSWFMEPSDKYPKFNHDGATSQFAFMSFLPKQKVAYALLINSMSATIGEDVRKAIFTEIAGLPREPKPVVPPAIKMDSTRYTGEYPGLLQSMTVTKAKPGHLNVQVRTANQPKPARLTLRAVAPDEFVILDKPQVDLGSRVLFLGDQNGRAKYYRWGARMNKRVEK